MVALEVFLNRLTGVNQGRSRTQQCDYFRVETGPESKSLRRGFWMGTCGNNAKFTIRTETTTRVLFGIDKNIVGDRMEKVLDGQK